MALSETGRRLIMARPPLLYLAGLALGLAAEHLFPTKLLDVVYTGLFGFAFMGLGLFMFIMAFVAFQKADVPIAHLNARDTLLQAGIYNMTRNPIYVGLTFLYGGIGLAANSLWVLGLLAVILPVMQLDVVKRDEAFLEQRFGEEFIRYARNVRRWI